MKIIKDELGQLYHQENRTLQQIGNILGVSKQYIHQKMVEFDLPRDPSRRGGLGRHKFSDLQEYLDYIKESGKKELSYMLVKLILSDQSLCEECGATDNLHLHHSYYPARSRNDLKVLCASCHLTKHRKGNGVQIQLEICKRYLAGKNGRELGKEYTVNSARIYQILHKWNIKVRPAHRLKKYK